MPIYAPGDVTLHITAGPEYDKATRVDVPVNAPSTVHISSPLIDVELNVRVKGYHGLPKGSPESSPYFELDRQAKAGWLYSIAFNFTLKNPAEQAGGKPEEGAAADDGVNAADLQWGNDFDRPVRANLPPGFNAALRIAKWLIDPGLDGDVYADRPYLFGPLISSMNTLHIGRASVSETLGLVVDEGETLPAADQKATGSDFPSATSVRKALSMPDDPTERSRWALRRDWSGNMGLSAFTFRYGQTYAVDFGNGYVDFSEFALRLPGYALGVLSVWDGQPFRYILRNKRTGEVYLAVVFDLLVEEELNEDGTIKEGVVVQKGVKAGSGGSGEVKVKVNNVDDTAAEVGKDAEKFEFRDGHGKDVVETKDDDVD